MNIVNIGLPQLPTKKANGVSLTQTCSALVDLGYSCTVFIPSYGKKTNSCEIRNSYTVNQKLDFIPIRVPNIPGRLYLFSFIASLKAIAMKPDVIFGRNVAAVSCVRVFSNIPYAFEIHSAIWTKKRIEASLFTWAIKSKQCIGVITNSLGLKKSFSSVLKNNSVSVKVAENGSKPVENNLLTEKINQRLQVGYFGSFFGGRGAGTIIDIANAVPEFDFNVFGVSLDMVNKQGSYTIPINLKFKGYVKHSEIDVHRAASNILLAPYSAEVVSKAGEDTAPFLSPIKLFEYMSSNRAMIITALPTIKDILNDDMALFVEPNCSVQDWVDALHKLREDSVRNKLGQRALDEFKNKYTWNHRAQKILELLTEAKK